MFRRMAVALCTILSLTAGTARGADPRLVVVISIDQFPYNYLERFRMHFGKDGFRRLLDSGATFTAASYEHALTVTAAGHAVILSGAYGDQQGIISNEWYDRTRHRGVSCVSDDTAQLVGAIGAGSSPRHFIGSTFGDELRIATGFQSKVISVSLKDRSAILLGGKLATAAYWMRDSAFVSSTYYLRTLPDWVRDFNTSGTINANFGRTWTRALPDSAYASMDRDDAPYEDGGKGLGITFPHPIHGGNPDRITQEFFNALIRSPFGNEILLNFAKQALVGEKLGGRGVTDLLCIGFSANDYVGHAYGPHSHEVLDMTVRTDRAIGDLLSFLDREIGLPNCIIALTSDHGVAPIPEYLHSRFPSADTRRVPHESFRAFCDSVARKNFGSPPRGNRWIEAMVGRNIYLNHNALRTVGIAPDAAAQVIVDALRRRDEVAAAYSHRELELLTPSSPLQRRFKHSFYPIRSGDVAYALKPYLFEGDNSTGTTHGDPYDYAAHVPLLLFGDGIQRGRYALASSPADLAPTLSALCGVEFPAGRDGRVLVEALKNR
jgi:predicted AlkP superfamily pyrophosphatase or phosphodiesterase